MAIAENQIRLRAGASTTNLLPIDDRVPVSWFDPVVSPAERSTSTGTTYLNAQDKNLRLGRDDRVGRGPVACVVLGHHVQAGCGQHAVPVDEVGLLLSGALDPVVVAVHRHQGATLGERRSEAGLGGDGLETGVVEPGLGRVLHEERLEAPPGELALNLSRCETLLALSGSSYVRPK